MQFQFTKYKDLAVGHAAVMSSGSVVKAGLEEESS